jgi:hypothetical protein
VNRADRTHAAIVGANLTRPDHSDGRAIGRRDAAMQQRDAREDDRSAPHD